MNEKPSRRSPAFLLYADDFLAGTLDLSQEEVGAFIRLLCHQWNRGSIPVEPEKQQRLAGGSVSVDVLAKFRLDENGEYRNDRLEEVRKDRQSFIESQRLKGLKSAEARKNQPKANPGSTPVGTTVQPNGQPEGQPQGNLPFPSPLPSPTKIQKQESSDVWHVEFGLSLPESLQFPECLESVKTWLKYKAEKRQSYKEQGLKAALTKWGNEFNKVTFCQAVDNSMANNYQGLFPPNKPNGSPAGSSASPNWVMEQMATWARPEKPLHRPGIDD